MSAQKPPNGAMEKVAAKLGRRARGRKGSSARSRPIPHLWFLTDPARTPDPAATAKRLPRGSAMVYRAFGASDALMQARQLREVTSRRGVKLLIGADWRLAAAVGADGVHLPQRLMGMAKRLRRSQPRWLISAAAHDVAAIVAGGRLGLDALLVSAVFPSRSASAGRALGPIRFAALILKARPPIIALGGVNTATAPRLGLSRAAGLAGIEGLRVD